MKNKILVLGDGLLGSEIIKQTGCNYISRKKDNFDINNLLSIPSGYTTIVNCIANTDTYSDDAENLIKVNHDFVVDLAIYCKVNKIKLVHISSDYVYANNKPFTKEVDTAKPHDCLYAKTKLMADIAISQIKGLNYLIIRCSHKPKPFPYDNAWEDYYTNADYVDVISGLIIKLIKKDAIGIVNVGTEPKTMYQLAKITNINVEPSNTPEHIPNNLIMDLRKMKKWI